MTKVDNLGINIGRYFDLSFIMTEMCSFYAKLGGSFIDFITGEVDNLSFIMTNLQ